MKSKSGLMMFIAIVMTLSLIFTGCVSVEVEPYDIDTAYSRATIEELASSIGFGYGKTDDETVALQYVYSNDELNEQYGDDFEVSDVGGSASMQQILWFYKADSEYYVNIGDDEWRIYLSKGYFSKWKVDGLRNMADEVPEEDK